MALSLEYMSRHKIDLRQPFLHPCTDDIAAHHAARAYHRKAGVFLLCGLWSFLPLYPPHRAGSTCTHIPAFCLRQAGHCTGFPARKGCICIPFTLDFGRISSVHCAARRETSAPAGKPKPSLSPHTVHSLSGIKVCAGAKSRDLTHLIAEQQIRRTAGNMEQQNFFSKQLFSLSCKQRCGSVTLLMGRQHKWDPFCMCKGRCSIDTCKKAWHIAALHRARLLRHSDSIDLCQIKFLRQLLHHLRQRDRMMKQCIAFCRRPS